jgi:hypothetical protein
MSNSHIYFTSSLFKHVPIPARTTLCRKGCCNVTWCPLEISWATTIHKFQGFEAGFGDNDMFRHLIVDPGDTKWEQTCPGALYVALSRAKTMGTFRSDTDHPLDSAIYWINSGICNFRILEGHMKKNKKKSGPKEKCVLITKREKWVQYLHKKESQTNTTFFNEANISRMTSLHHSQEEVREMIASMITTPNKSWAKRKKLPQYSIPRNYFGQYA